MHDANGFLSMALHLGTFNWGVFGDLVLSTSTDSCWNREARESIPCSRMACRGL